MKTKRQIHVHKNLICNFVENLDRAEAGLSGNDKMNQSAEKIKFMECRMAGQPHKFVLQTTPPQYLYQVMEFEDMEQYKAFSQADKGTGMIHSQVGSRMMALRLSACLMDLGLRQDNVKEKTEQLYGTIMEAAKWYNEFLSNY